MWGMMTHRHTIYGVRTPLIGFVTLVLLWGCAHSKPGPADSPSPVLEARGVTVVLPFVDMAKIYGSNTTVRNPLTSKVFVTGIIEEKAALGLTNELYRLIGQETKLKWGAFQDTQGSQESSPFSPSGMKKVHHAKRLQALGRQEGADTIMIGYLYAFRDRSGGDFGAERPSHVALELVMMQSGSGRIVWHRSFKEIQKSLSENLLQLKSFIKRKGRWVSAQEMAKGALKEMLQTVPQLDSH